MLPCSIYWSHALFLEVVILFRARWLTAGVRFDVKFQQGDGLPYLEKGLR